MCAPGRFIGDWSSLGCYTQGRVMAVGVVNVKLHLKLSSLISHFYILSLMWILDPDLLCLDNEHMPTIS